LNEVPKAILALQQAFEYLTSHRDNTEVPEAPSRVP
jgi:hypothetical protein